MARLFQPGFRNHSTSNWEHDNASDCSGSWSFDSASRALFWRKLIRLGKKLIKKTPESNARQQRRPMGAGRSRTSSSKARDAECGYRQKPKTRLSITIQRARVSAISQQF